MLWLPLYRTSIKRSPVTHGIYYKRNSHMHTRGIGSPLNENVRRLACTC
jgi:hypothetical protein